MFSASRSSVGCAFALLLTIAACGSNVRVQTSSSNAAGVARRQTYALDLAAAPPSGYVTTPRTPEVLAKAGPRISAELERRGYAVAPEAEADMVVHVSSGSRKVVEEPSGGALRAGAPSMVDEVGILIVEIVDRKTNEKLFSGTAKKDIHTSKVDEAEIAAAVAQLLEPVPAAAAARSPS
jgi:hypothetical protein